jgi:hypothetical protein
LAGRAVDILDDAKGNVGTDWWPEEGYSIDWKRIRALSENGANDNSKTQSIQLSSGGEMNALEYDENSVFMTKYQLKCPTFSKHRGPAQADNYRALSEP